MALDGIVVASLAKELQENFTNARLSKIAQPEKDELLLTLKGPNGQKRLLLSASASLPHSPAPAAVHQKQIRLLPEPVAAGFSFFCKLCVLFILCRPPGDSLCQ